MGAVFLIGTLFYLPTKMHHICPMKELVFTTNNKNKLAEIQQMLGANYLVKDLAAIGCHVDIPENENTLEGNALAKARYVKKHYGLDCFADDTGLLVDALNGAPGVYSARYAGPEKNDAQNIAKLLHELANNTNRKAHFKTVIALILDGKEYLFTGIANGQITTSRYGENGFGYDPIFKPTGCEQTFAEMSLAQKNPISHRGKAVQKLVEFLQAN